MLERLLAYFTPPAIAADVASWENQRAKLIILASSIIIVLALPSLVLYYCIGSWILGSLALFAVLTSTLALLLLRYKESLRLSVTVLLWGLFMILVASILVSGGVLSPLIFSLYAPPIFGLLFYSRKMMLQVFIISTLFIVVLIILYWQGLTLPTLYPSELYGIWQGLISIPLLMGAISAFYFSDVVRQQMLFAMQRERDSVQEKVREATEALQMQQSDISRINASLEEQNVQLLEAINEAEIAKRLQTDFLRNVSHEVRTPLSAVMGFAEILQERANPDDTVSKEFSGQIYVAGQNLLDMFNNILALAAIEASGVEIAYELGHLPTILKDLERSIQQQIRQKGLTCSFFWTKECETSLQIDAHHLREIIRYLLANAIKFTEHGAISVQCEFAAMPDNADITSLRIRVADTGIGIEKEYLQNLFTSFRQQDTSKNRRFGGLGLGLAIVKKLVDAMHGAIRCESVVNQGTTFIIDIPQGKTKKPRA